ncbi:MAG: hypothetical protein WBG92_02760 [Thiohalocapsa sp.]
MKRSARLAISLLLAATTAGAGQRMVEGVPWDAVDWETLCKNVKPLKYTSSTGQVCPKVHPADSVWRKWHDSTGRGKPERKHNCEALAERYERRIKKVGGCKTAFASALRFRASKPEDFDEPLKVWRARYFGPWIQGD